MRCQRAQQRLMAYHDGELSPGARRRVEKHLESCDECSQLLERLRLADHHASSVAGVNDMVGVPGMPLPEDRYWESFTARVLDRVEEDAATRAPERRKPRRSWGLIIPRMAPAFSIALVVVVAAGVLMKIGDPMLVPKDPVVILGSAQEKDAPVTDREVSHGEPDRGEKVYYADTPDEEPRRASVEETHEIDDAYRPAPATVLEPEPEQTAALKEMEVDTSALKKREAVAAPEVEVETDEDGAEAAPGPEAGDALSRKAAAGKPLPSAPAKMDGGEVVLGYADKAAPVTGDAGLDPIEGRDDLAQEKTMVPPAEPSVLQVTAGAEMDNNVMVTGSASMAADREEADSPVPDALVGTLEEPDEQRDDVALFAPGEPSEESKGTVSGMKALRSSMPAEGAKQTFASRAHLYRGPEDQLLHAENLADVRKFWESEQVLKDLLSQRPPFPIQEEASILLVKVLSSQNRFGEAQQVLDDARGQFPASEMIQTFDLKQNGE